MSDALTTLTAACALDVGSKAVELLVQREDTGWRWEMRFADGATLDGGAAATRWGAQFAAQAAFERRLRRAGLHQGQFAGYRWLDATGS